MKRRLNPCAAILCALAIVLIASGVEAQTVTVRNVNATAGEFDLIVTGNGNVTLSMASGAAPSFDWCKPGGELATVATPTVPNLGVPNNDGITSKSFTVVAPVTTHCDYDPNVAYPGMQATVNGVTKPLALVGSDYVATFSAAPSPPGDPGITGNATLTWVAPTTNADGTPLTDLAGFVVYWSQTQGTYTSSVRIANPGATTYTVTNLAAGTWYFVVTAFDSTNLESLYSSVVSKVITNPSDPCTTSPLAAPTNLAWPTARNGRAALGWNTPANIVAIAYAWPNGGLQSATFTDDRGCKVTVTH